MFIAPNVVTDAMNICPYIADQSAKGMHLVFLAAVVL
jgi:hypothetical protein